jgi:transcriptional regulator with XRE-family HTH domain
MTGSEFHTLRRSLRVRQQDLAKRASVSQSVVSYVENDKPVLPVCKQAVITALKAFEAEKENLVAIAS